MTELLCMMVSLLNPIYKCQWWPTDLLRWPLVTSRLSVTRLGCRACARQPAQTWFYSKHQLCVRQLFSHLYCHARRRRSPLPLSAAAKNRQALSVCKNPSREKKERLLSAESSASAICSNRLPLPSPREEPNAEKQSF